MIKYDIFQVGKISKSAGGKKKNGEIHKNLQNNLGFRSCTVHLNSFKTKTLITPEHLASEFYIKLTKKNLKKKKKLIFTGSKNGFYYLIPF